MWHASCKLPRASGRWLKHVRMAHATRNEKHGMRSDDYRKRQQELSSLISSHPTPKQAQKVTGFSQQVSGRTHWACKTCYMPRTKPPCAKFLPRPRLMVRAMAITAALPSSGTPPKQTRPQPGIQNGKLQRWLNDWRCSKYRRRCGHPCCHARRRCDPGHRSSRAP